MSTRCSPHARGGRSWAGGREAVVLVPGGPPVAVQPDLPLQPDDLPGGEHLQPGQEVVHQQVPLGVHVGTVPYRWGGVLLAFSSSSFTSSLAFHLIAFAFSFALVPAWGWGCEQRYVRPVHYYDIVARQGATRYKRPGRPGGLLEGSS